MQSIPLLAQPSQTLEVLLGAQYCRINVYQKRARGLFVDLYVNDVLVIGGVIAENANRIVRSAYLGFVGDLSFFDLEGTDDPDYTQLGTRFILAYLSPEELLG